MRILIALLIAAISARETVGQRRIVLLGGRMLDVRSGTYRTDVAIAVVNGRIASIESRSAPRTAGDSVIDLSGATILPGLIDAHVHFAIAGRRADNALTTLRAGFTTVADLGDVGPGVLRLRDSINAGLLNGPRILAAGKWVGTGGGICEFGGIGVRGDSSAFRARVRENVADGADLIKVCISKWLPAAFASPDDYEIADAALTAVTSEAHVAKRLVIAHDLSRGGVRAGIRAGIDGLAHGAIVDSSLALDLARQRIFMVPTLASLTGAGQSPAASALVSSVRRAYQLGVPIVFGTDAGVIPHGDNAQEFPALVAAGLTPIDAIRSATINAARALRISDDAGTIEVGRPADLIAVTGDPVADVSVLARVRFVMRGGRVVRNDF